jgi:murein DD-endopeptidase MepM/ murein hydrolase activator NlpD
MIKGLFKIYIPVLLVLMLFATQAVAQQNPVVPLPLKENPLDSAAILQAKYDSLVRYMNQAYGLDVETSASSTHSKSTIPTHADTSLVVSSSKEIAPSKDTIIEPTPIAVEVATPKPIVPAVTPTASVATQTTPITQAVNASPIPTVAVTAPIAAHAIDSPRPKPTLPKVVVPEPDPLEGLSTEELLVDTLEADSVEYTEGDEADSEGEAEGEFDNLFTGYNDVSYWDMLRDPNFKFEPSMIPADHHYPYDWDTVVINPYKVSLMEMTDTVLLKLKDSMDCSFHPPAIGDVTSTFGWRRWGRKPKFHYGVDVRMEVGDPVYAIFDGVVRVAKRSSDYGYVVLIRHYNGLETLYAHFDQLLAYAGKPVRSGEIIGLSGNTGRSTGPHLHFEVRFKGEKIDPNKIIYFPSGSLLSDTLQIDKHCFNHLRLYKAQQQKLRSRYYVVKRGDTIGKIAYKNGVTAKQIARLNRISTKTKLKAGRRIRIR